MKKIFYLTAIACTLSTSMVQAQTLENIYLNRSPLVQQLSLSTYTTKFDVKDEARMHNIQLAASKINNVIINPNETFSFNDALGKTNADAGYKESKIFIDGETVDGIGGGICQVSSTLYNVVLDSDLEVVERHPHSSKVLYVPTDRDAATSYNGVDLKFTNTTNTPLKIKTAVHDGNLEVSLVRF